MPVTIDALVGAGFPKENFPEDLPEPGEANITMSPMDGSHELYRYEVNMGGKPFAMEIVVDRGTIDDPAEGVGFMLNQFAYLWRMDRVKLEVAAGGACRRINF